jgi:hypothetical protein
MKIKTKNQAREFVVNSLIAHLESCSEEMNSDFVEELSFYLLGCFIYEHQGSDGFEEIVRKVRGFTQDQGLEKPKKKSR